MNVLLINLEKDEMRLLESLQQLRGVGLSENVIRIEAINFLEAEINSHKIISNEAL